MTCNIPFLLTTLCCSLGLFWLALGIDAASLSTLRFSTLGSVSLPSRWALLACSVLLAGLGICGGRKRSQSPRLRLSSLGGGAVVLVLGVLIWASSTRQIEVLGLLPQSVRLATPIALGALAGIVCERSGIVNIGLEGGMLTAACLGFTAALYSQNVWIGVLAAMLASMLLAALHAVLTIHGQVNHIISGTVLNILAVGLSGWVRRTLLLHHPYSAPATLPFCVIPWLSEVPVLGTVLLRYQPIVYSMLLLVALLHMLLYNTPWGLRTRAIGEHPHAARTLGVHVLRLRYTNVIASGLLTGLAGAWFSLETVGTFEELMTGGKGFMALAAMIFGRWQPWPALASALLFGFSDALQIKLQISGVDVPYQLLNMLPYVITMLVLAGVIGRAVPPAAAGQPYTPEAPQTH